MTGRGGARRAVVAHSVRFRKVSNRYPARVAEAYGGDIAHAAAEDDEQVAATVAAWEQAQGAVVRDWTAQGASEHVEASERLGKPA